MPVNSKCYLHRTLSNAFSISSAQDSLSSWSANCPYSIPCSWMGAMKFFITSFFLQYRHSRSYVQFIASVIPSHPASIPCAMTASQSVFLSSLAASIHAALRSSYGLAASLSPSFPGKYHQSSCASERASTS